MSKLTISPILSPAKWDVFPFKLVFWILKSYGGRNTVINIESNGLLPVAHKKVRRSNQRILFESFKEVSMIDPGVSQSLIVITFTFKSRSDKGHGHGHVLIEPFLSVIHTTIQVEILLKHKRSRVILILRSSIKIIILLYLPQKVKTIANVPVVCTVKSTKGKNTK